jgi:ABC-type branched-subunit amino acid transport system ATPase component
VLLARAFRRYPALLLLDGVLDEILPAGRTAIARMLRAASRELDFGVVLTTTAADDAVQAADCVLVLSHGRVAAEIPVGLGERRSRDSAGYRRVREAVSSAAFVDWTDSLVRSA